ncbi:MAG: starch-binding protein [Lachnospiraceae bacterium]|nr:starch-binding protein [Lachnospiraceae bacterium]
MAIRLCHSCAREVRDGDKVCRYCNAILDESHSVIEIGGEEEGFSFGSNKNAYEDEALKNFKQEQLDVNYEKVSQDKALATYQKTDESFDENDIEDDMDDNESIQDVYKGVIDVIKHPKDYIPLFVGLFSCLLIIGSMLLPLYVTAGGKSRFMYENDLYSLGLLLGVCLIIALVVIFKFRQKYVVVPAICIATMLVYLLIYFAKLETFGKLGFGYYILWFASVMLISSAVILNNTEGTSNKNNLALDKKDFIWMMVCLLLSVIVINRLFDFTHMETDDELKAEATENTAVKIVVEDGNVELKILDTYIIKNTSPGKNQGKDYAIIKINLDNNRKDSVKFDEIFSINVYQNEKPLEKSYDNNIEGYELSKSSTTVDGGSNQDIYFGYELLTKDDINVSVSKNSNNVLVFNDNLKLNQQYYKNDDEIVTEEPVPTKTAVVQKTPTEQDTTPVAIVTEAPVPTEEPVVSTPQPTKTTYNVYFTKPTGWGDRVWIYIYMNDENDSELLKENNSWPGVEMTMVKTNVYKYTIDEEWVTGNSRCLFSDGNFQYPGKPENNGAPTGEKVTGNMNIQVPE